VLDEFERVREFHREEAGLGSREELVELHLIRMWSSASERNSCFSR
jgi:hypothetical protein